MPLPPAQPVSNEAETTAAALTTTRARQDE
jgi:hypothetical protein